MADGDDFAEKRRHNFRPERPEQNLAAKNESPVGPGFQALADRRGVRAAAIMPLAIFHGLATYRTHEEFG